MFFYFFSPRASSRTCLIRRFRVVYARESREIATTAHGLVLFALEDFEIVISIDFKRNVFVLSSTRLRRLIDIDIWFSLDAVYVPVRAYFSWRFRRLPMAVNMVGRISASTCMFSRSVMVM